MEINREEAEKLAYKILKEVQPILDRRQRCYALGKKLRKLDEELILEVFDVICQKAKQKISIFQDGFRIIGDIRLLSYYVGYGKMSIVYSLARRKNYEDVARFMAMTPPQKLPGPGEEPVEDHELKELTLGQRKSLARTRDRDLINRLCHDQDPAVIHILLQNPVLTLKEVVRIASKRPTNSQILWVVYRSSRWLNYYSIKKALINNPYTPTQISLSLLHFLLEQDLADIAENQILHPKLQEAALKMLLERRQKEAHAKKEQERESELDEG